MVLAVVVNSFSTSKVMTFWKPLALGREAFSLIQGKLSFSGMVQRVKYRIVNC